jgi:hypothetical protein
LGCSFLKELEALENDEPAFRLFTDVLSRFIISGAVNIEPQPSTLGADVKKRRSRSTTSEVDETQMARRVTFAVDEKVKTNKRNGFDQRFFFNSVFYFS